MNHRNWLACGFAAFLSVDAVADFSYLSNFASWQQLAPPHTTIDFTDLNPGDWLTDQYLNLGASFDGGLVQYGADGYLQDGYGVYGGCYMDVVLSTPALAVGTHNPGSMRFKLYQGDQLIYTSPSTGSGLNNFRGVISSVPFDRVLLMGDTLGPPSCDAIFVDNFYFASVPGPGSAVVLTGSMLMKRRRRR